MNIAAHRNGPEMSGQELRALIAEYGLSQGQFAELVGIHRNTVSRWLTYEADGAGKTIRGTPIDAANALLVHARLASLKRKKRLRAK